MPSVLKRILLMAVCLSAIPALKAHAAGLFGRRVETVYVTPVESVLTVPTSYDIPTSYPLPTSYVYPTSYILPTTYRTSAVYATSYYTPTYYLSPTAYVVPTYRATRYVVPRTRIVERPIVTTQSTYYYTPTVARVEEPIVTSSESICEESAPAPASEAQTRITAPPTTSQRIISSSPKSQSEPVEVRVPANPEPELRTERPAPADANPPANPVPAAPNHDESPTSPPAPEPPTLPGEHAGPVPDGDGPRESFKPAPPSGSILEGKVVSAISGQPEPGVRILVSNLAQPAAFTERKAETDALGRYAIQLPAGDWSVQIATSDGKVKKVKNITVSGGQITTTDEGRSVPSLIINR